MKKEKKKPYRSMASNGIWGLRMQLKYAPLVFGAKALEVPVNIGIQFWSIYLPSLVVKEATGSRSFPEIFRMLAGLWLFAALLNLAKDVLERSREGSMYRERITRLLNRKSLFCFYEEYEKKDVRDLGERARIATEMWDGKQPLNDMTDALWALVENVLCYLLFGSLLADVSPWMFPLVMAGPVLNVIALRIYNNWYHKNRVNYMGIGQKLDYVCYKPDDFKTAKDIRIYSMADWFRQTYRELIAELDVWENQKAIRKFMVSLLSLVMILIRDGAAYAVLIKMTLDGGISVDQFVLYFAAVSSFASFFGNILNEYNKLHEASLRICDVREYLDLPEQNSSGGESLEEHLLHAPEITFDHVTFRYDGAKEDTIKNLSFTIKSGESVALVGLNGAGKTTLVKLLCGLYRPTSGEIRLNGESIEKFSRADYYRLFSPVFQDAKTAFFSLAETVAGKIGEGIDEEKAEHCMRLAGLGNKIDALPKGIHTKMDKQVYEDAIELSGGEVQKLMLARALYKDAPMLVLDEPTAALDPIAESAIYQEYRQMTEGKSALFISHRLASTRFCDRIIHLKDGKICEEGTHEDLIRAKGEYSELFEIQSCWYREDYKKEGEAHEAV